MNIYNIYNKTNKYFHAWTGTLTLKAIYIEFS